MQALLADLRDLVVAPCCAGCGRGADWFCAACRDACDPVTLALGPSLAVTAAATFEGPLRAAVHRLKYRGDHGLARELGGLAGTLVARDLARGARIDAVVPVPLHPRRARDRGYDQAALLARAAAEAAGLPLVPALRRIRYERPLVELDRAAREDAVRGAFCGVAGSLRGARVALVDDVVTTGATLRAAAAAARSCGARGVRAYVVGADA
ncbi:MAG TPA: phosphoribosyltransferase family protein [Candidatus Limnocylindria bacterium]|nr:phosphoribosyltransferase family protein [Candidatus Limnocylindria bacterium]